MVNEGNTPRCNRETRGSSTDVTLFTGDLRGKLRNWRVANEEVYLSNHNNIYNNVATDTTGNKYKRLAPDNQACKYEEDDATGFLEASDKEMNREDECRTEKLDRAIKTACQKVLKRKGKNKYMTVYRWNTYIAELRKTLWAAKRNKTGGNRKGTLQWRQGHNWKKNTKPKEQT